MAWLKGSTDIANFQADIFNLLTGAAAAGQRGSGQAGNGVTVGASDLWTSIDSTNKVCRSQRTDSPFQGEYTMWRGIPRFAARATGTVMTPIATAQVGKPTFSGAYTNGGTNPRVYFAAYCSTNNSSPGSLVGTVITWTEVNADDGSTIASGTASGWTGASDTKLLAHGVSLTLTLQVSQSFVGGTNAIMWLRSYTATYTNGVDYFPEGCKVKSSTLTLATISGGTNAYTSGTDYDLAQEQHDYPQASTTIGVVSANTDFGGNGAASGIHWKTGGSPPAVGGTYYIPATYEVYQGYFQTPGITAISSNYWLTCSVMDFWDPNRTKGRWRLNRNSGYDSSLNTTIGEAQLFTGTSQASTTFVNYWISVKNDKIVMIFRGDPGQSGRLVVLAYLRYTPLVTQDKWPWIFIPDASATGSDGAALAVSHKPVYSNPYWGDPALSVGNVNRPFYLAAVFTTAGYVVYFTGIGADGATSAAMPRQNPNNWDLRWWLYTVYIRQTLGGSNLAGTFDSSKTGHIRGKLRGIFAMATDNMSSLDELSDGANTYLLVIPTTLQFNGCGVVYNAIAILEE